MPSRVAIITGAGTGIGRATALRLSGMGYRVALVGRQTTTLQNVADEIQLAGGEILIVPADVSQLAQVDAMVQRVLHAWSRIDLLVNNAGMAPSMPLAEMDPELWHQVLNANLSSAFYATRAVWPVMRAQHEAAKVTDSAHRMDPDGGIIINISSMAAKDPFPGFGAYAIAKSGINMLTLVTAREGNSVGIRVVAIAPGAVDTAMFRSLVAPQNIDAEQLLLPDDVAAAIAGVVAGPLRYASGETLYLHHSPA